MSAKRVVLVGCVATKVAAPRPARDLYASPLFKFRRRYAELAVESGEATSWLVLSAEHGLVSPQRVIEPYSRTLQTRGDVDELAIVVRPQLMPLDTLGVDVLEVHAGALYVDAVRQAVAAYPRFFAVEQPLRGLGIGEQLSWYRRLFDAL